MDYSNDTLKKLIQEIQKRIINKEIELEEKKQKLKELTEQSK